MDLEGDRLGLDDGRSEGGQACDEGLDERIVLHFFSSSSTLPFLLRWIPAFAGMTMGQFVVIITFRILASLRTAILLRWIPAFAGMTMGQFVVIITFSILASLRTAILLRWIPAFAGMTMSCGVRLTIGAATE